MAIPHPFKTKRTVGSSAGGNVHTLAAHMASPSAHPGYVKKGDQVGSANIAEHEYSPLAHITTLLRRLELATSEADFADTKNMDVSWYDGSDTGALGTPHPVIVTTRLLNVLFGSDTVSRGPMSHLMTTSRIKTTMSFDDAVDNTTVPSMSIIKTIKSTLDACLTKVEAAKLYATASHTHEEYADKNHTHSFEDVVNSDGYGPAASNHNHDDVYIRRDEGWTGPGGDVDLGKLSDTGIYPVAVGMMSDPNETKIDLNINTAQGNYTFVFNKNTLDGIDNLPAAVVSTLKESSFTDASVDDIKVTANLTVTKAEFEDDQVSGEIASAVTNRNATLTALGSSIVQKILIDSSIRKFVGDDALSASVKKHATQLHRMFTRNGYTYETARWIMSVLKFCFNATAKAFYHTISSDPVTAIANKINDGIDTFFTEVITVDDLGDVVPGYVNATAQMNTSRMVRASVDMFESDEDKTDYIVNAKYAVGPIQNAIVHDRSSWILRGSLTGTKFSDVTADVAQQSAKNMTMFRPYSVGYLPYVRYFATYGNKTQVTDFPRLISDIADYVVTYTAEGGAIDYIELKNHDAISYYYVDTNNISDASLDVRCVGRLDNTKLARDEKGNLIIDSQSRVLHGYIPLQKHGTSYIRTSDTVKDDSKTYYVYNGIGFEEFEGEFEDGVDYYELVESSNVYKLNGDYFVKAEDPKVGFIKLIQRADGGSAGHWKVGDPVGWNIDNHNVELDYSSIDGAATTDNQVFQRVAIVACRDNYQMLSPGLIAQGPSEGVVYFSSSAGVMNPIDIVDGQFNPDVTYYINEPIADYMWSKCRLNVGDRTPNNLKYYKLTNDLQWTDEFTDEIRLETTLGEKNYSVYIDWVDVFDVSSAPKLQTTTPTKDTTRLLSRALFYRTHDTRCSENKVYWIQDTSITKRVQFIELVPDVSINPAERGDVYEMLDTARFLDIWCAIHELTTYGAVRAPAEDVNGIVYNFGNDEGLVTWDDWVEVITEFDDRVKLLETLDLEALESIINSLNDPEKGSIDDLFQKAHTHTNIETLGLLGKFTVNDESDPANGKVRLKFDSQRVAMYSEIYRPTNATTLDKFSVGTDGNIRFDGHLLALAGSVFNPDNKEILSKFGVDANGKLTYDGAPIASGTGSSDYDPANKDELAKVTADVTEKFDLLKKLGIDTDGSLTLNGASVTKSLKNEINSTLAHIYHEPENENARISTLTFISNRDHLFPGRIHISNDRYLRILIRPEDPTKCIDAQTSPIVIRLRRDGTQDSDDDVILNIPWNMGANAFTFNAAKAIAFDVLPRLQTDKPYVQVCWSVVDEHGNVLDSSSPVKNTFPSPDTTIDDKKAISLQGIRITSDSKLIARVEHILSTRLTYSLDDNAIAAKQFIHTLPSATYPPTIVGKNADQVLSPVIKRSGNTSIYLTIRPTDPTKTLDDVLFKDGRGLRTLVQLSSTSPAKTMTPGNIVVAVNDDRLECRIVNAAATDSTTNADMNLIQDTLPVIGGVPTLGPSMSFVVSAESDKTWFNWAYALASTRSSVNKSNNHWCDTGLTNQQYKYISVADGLTVDINVDHELRTSSTITDVASELAMQNVSNERDMLNRVEAVEAAKHTHSNKDVLDTVNADVVNNSHTHSNKATLEKVTEAVVNNSHAHSNKTAVDNLTQSVIDDSHKHDNQATLDKVTDDMVNNSHKHNNATPLGKIGESNSRATYNGAGIAMQGDFVVISRAEYNDLATKDPNKFYFVYES